jgi:hypothetical protein
MKERETNSLGVETVLAISDLQYPFAHRDHLDFLKAVADKYSPTRVVCIGDEADFHSLSAYTHDPDGYSSGDEYRATLKDLHKLYQVFPRVVSLESNHTSRPFRKAFEAGIPKLFIRPYREFLEAPVGWSWKEREEIDGVLYEHGLGMTGQYAHLRAALANMQSTVMGHLHANFGVEYAANRKVLVFGMAIGCLMDSDSYASAYGKVFKRKPILGTGIVVRGIPIPVPMLLKKGGRWSGQL